MITLYHFTHINHLELIATQGILCDALAQEGGLMVEVGNRDIKANRRDLAVSAGPGGCPADYVPFYFAPRSPMLYTIWKGNVPHYQEGLEPLIYLVTTVERVVEAGLRIAFSDGNCGSFVTDYSDDLGQLDEFVDWDLMKATMWNNTLEDGDRMRRRMAEFLVHERVPWDIVNEVGTMTAAIAQQVNVTLADLGCRTTVRVRREWYYP
jgi:hypothetical protein